MVTPLLASFMAVVTGVIVLAFWAQPERTQRDRRSARLGIVHATVAVGAVALWTVFVINRARTVGRVSLGLLVAAVMVGVATIVSSRRGERTHSDIEPVPIALLALHAVLAGATLVAAVVAFPSR